MIEFRLAQEDPGEELTEAENPANGRKIYYHNQVFINNQDIASAKAKESITPPHYDIEITFTEAGAEKLALVMRENVMKNIAMFVNGELITAPRIMSEIPASFGKVLIVGRFSEEEAKDIVESLK